MGDPDNQAAADAEFAFQMLSNNTADGVPTEVVKKSIEYIENKFGVKPNGIADGASKGKIDELEKKEKEVEAAHQDYKEIIKSSLFRLWITENIVDIYTEDVGETIEIINKFKKYRDSLPRRKFK